MTNERSVPHSRLRRLGQLGRLASGVAGGALSEGVRQLSRGQRPSMGDMILTPGNAKRVADRLAEMRGAAMKVGQLLSMESGEILPPELTEVLARLRKDAYRMPLGQVAQVLENAWGKHWEKQFQRFSFTPLAAASIGQVHEATLKDGTHMAVKVQYPGVRDSIDSDVDNVATLLRWTTLVPKEVDFAPLLDVAKTQLHEEADYLAEADHLRRFGQWLADDAFVCVPDVIDHLTTTDVLSMTFMNGKPLESVEHEEAELRNRVATELLQLTMRELFEWRSLQSDPNFANFLFDHDTQTLQLLDFGATRHIDVERAEQFRTVLHAAAEQDDNSLVAAATGIGYLEANDPAPYQAAIVDLLRTACEPIRESGSVNFGNSDLAKRISNTAYQMRMKEKFGRLPPPDVLFLHRKLAGLYLLFTRLKVDIPVRDIVLPFIHTSMTEQ
ncbi:MAG: ABC1 kinase family protein [bacterium]